MKYDKNKMAMSWQAKNYQFNKTRLKMFDHRCLLPKQIQLRFSRTPASSTLWFWQWFKTFLNRIFVIFMLRFCLFWNHCNFITTRCRFCRESRYSIEVYVTSKGAQISNWISNPHQSCIKHSCDVKIFI